ncbi:hypothetical protein P2318_01095 [Myxococcaceae bacterium GXIMD 01537]
MSRKNSGAGKPAINPAGMGSPVRALPGAGASEPTRAEWIDVTVMPREAEAPPRGRGGPRAPRQPAPPHRDRGEVYAEGVRQSTAFRDSLMRWLDERNLIGAVRAVSEPGSLPMLTLRCAPRVLDQLRRAPEFEAGMTLPVEFLSR